MKQKVFCLTHDIAKRNCMSFVGALSSDCGLEVVIRSRRQSKTLAQLGALFGLWFEEIQDQTGEDKKTLHKNLKDWFLARIYVTDPVGPDQEQWVDLLVLYQQKGETEKLQRHAARISLKWASIEQMRVYLDDVQAFYANTGVILSVPDKFHKAYQNE